MKGATYVPISFENIQRGSLVLAAVSGGADSMCLLSLLYEKMEEKGFALAAAHFNHNLRGAESDGDAAFVKEYCEKLGIDCYVGSGDVMERRRSLGESTEEAARALRYEFLFKTAEDIGAHVIATAHTADDNLETVIMNMVRGTGLKGLGGIPPVRGKIVRPMLAAQRRDIEAYLDERGIPYREDSTNASDDYTRNLIRHKVVPVLKEINPAASANVCRMTALLREDEKALSDAAAEAVERTGGDRIPAETVLDLPAAVSRRVIRSMAGVRLSAEHTQKVLDLCKSDVSPSAQISLPGMIISREYGDLVFRRENTERIEAKKLEYGGEVVLPQTKVRITCSMPFVLKSCEQGKIYKSLNLFLFKTDNICGTMLVRSRDTGDTMCLAGRGVTKSLKKLFIESKIPASQRDGVPVIADEKGVLCVPNVGWDRRVAAKAGDTVVKIKIEEII